jgi:hypothetical protein
MADSVNVLQQQLDDVRAAIRRARELIGVNVTSPPEGIEAKPDAAKEWVI